MFKKLFFIAVLFTGVVACKSKSAFNYSQDIVKKEKSLAPQIKETETKVRKYVATEQFDSVVVAAEDMEKLVQEKIDEINALAVPKGKESDNFKTAVLRYFNYIKSMYAGYKKLGKAPTEEARQEVITELQKLVEEKQEVLSEMQSAQKKFADANGFKVE